MEYTTMTLAEQIAEDYREKLIEWYGIHNLDPVIIKQIKEFDTEALLCMAARKAIAIYELEIEQIKEEQKQH